MTNEVSEFIPKLSRIARFNSLCEIEKIVIDNLGGYDSRNPLLKTLSELIRENMDA
jgi:hypothetical protein